MDKKGKLSRAMVKAGEEKKLEAEPVGPAAPPPDPALRRARTTAPYPTAPAARDLKRVQGKAGPPALHAVLFHDKTSEVAAQIRSLRSRVLGLNRGNPPRIITISSATREEGKTTIAYNFALALSEIDAGRILLMDGDLFRPSLHEIANVRATSGLNQVLDSHLDLSGCIYETTVHNLDLLPAQATVPGNGNMGVLHQQCGKLLQKLRQYYSFVIIDTPPVRAGSQASMFGKHSDGVIMCVEVEKTPRHVVSRATEELKAAGANVVGCVLTKQKHHVPDVIYRFFGTTPSRYYRYGHSRKIKPSSRPKPSKENSDADS